MLCSLVDSCSSLDLHLVFQCCLIAELDSLLHAEQLGVQCSIAMIACTSGLSLDGSWQVPMIVSSVALQSCILAVSHFETALMCNQCGCLAWKPYHQAHAKDTVQGTLVYCKMHCRSQKWIHLQVMEDKRVTNS